MTPVSKKRISSTDHSGKHSGKTNKKMKLEEKINENIKSVKRNRCISNLCTPKRSKCVTTSVELPNSKCDDGLEKAPEPNTRDEILKTNDINSMDVAQLLALGENSKLYDGTREVSSQEFSDSDESEFEEVKHEIKNHEIPKEGISITLDMPLMKRKNKMQIDAETLIRRQVNRIKKNIQSMMHKVHLLCWIAHIKYVNTVLNTPSLMKSCMTLITTKNIYPSKYADLNYLENLIKWFHKNVEIQKNNVVPECKGGLLNELLFQIKNKKAYTSKDFILIFIVLLRVLGLKARIIMSFQVLPLKPLTSELMDSKNSQKNLKENSVKIKDSEDNLIEKEKSHECRKEINSKTKKRNDSLEEKKIDLRTKNKRNSLISNTESEAKKESLITKTVKGKKKVAITVNASAEEIDGGDDDEDGDLNYFKKSCKTQSSETGAMKNSSKKIVTSKKGRKKKRESIITDTGQPDSEEEYFHEHKNKIVIKKNERLSTSANEENSAVKKTDIWAEVFLENEEKWISVDVIRQKVHCINELYSRATHPVLYVIACNNNSSLKDVTKRYVPNWHSDTRKKRIDDEWWNETMKPYLPPLTAQEKEEDEEIIQQLHDKPIPCVIAEFKNHPLYALKRHLLKFEAIYPPDAPTLGFVRGEPVYARECVVTLHSREMWYKQARVVRLKEEPYKIVKARPKYDKMTGEVKKDIPLELFGIWQTEEYIPPIAVDGKVPRNEYGNVDLFKPCMLPLGTVHLQIPALIKVAKKLGIDCAPATVGFEYHSGGSHPVFDGFVVCEEFKETLLDHWNKEIDESAKRSEDKKEKRVYGNWKRLIKGLLIREKLKSKYSFGQDESDQNFASTSLKT